jgi:hypothetical protein
MRAFACGYGKQRDKSLDLVCGFVSYGQVVVLVACHCPQSLHQRPNPSVNLTRHGIAAGYLRLIHRYYLARAWRAS